MATQLIKAIKVFNHSNCEVTDSMPTTAKMMCVLKSLTFADSEVELSECHKFESVGWHKAGL